MPMGMSIVLQVLIKGRMRICMSQFVNIQSWPLLTGSVLPSGWKLKMKVKVKGETHPVHKGWRTETPWTQQDEKKRENPGRGQDLCGYSHRNTLVLDHKWRLRRIFWVYSLRCFFRKIQLTVPLINQNTGWIEALTRWWFQMKSSKLITIHPEGGQ